MTAILTSKRRLSQIPRGAVSIDWTNDLAKSGLVSLVLPRNTANRHYNAPAFVRNRYGDAVQCTGGGFIWQRTPAFGSKASIYMLGGLGQEAGGTALPLSVGTTTSGGNQLFALQGFTSASLLARAIVRTSNGGGISTAELAGSGDGVVYPDDTTWLAVYDGTANLGLYRNGVNAVASRSNTAVSGPLSSMDNIALGGVMRGTPTAAGGGSRQYLGMAFNQALGSEHAKELNRNPWQVLRPTTRRIWVPVSVGGGAGNASGSLAGLVLSPASAGAYGAAQATATLSSIGITPAQASASGGASIAGNAAASLAALSLTAAQASASGAASASAALDGITIAPSTASASGSSQASAALVALQIAPASATAFGGASVPGNASATLASLSTTPATASASGAATAAGPLVGMNLTPAQAQAAGSAWASAELRALSVTPASGLARGPVTAPELGAYLSVADARAYLSVAQSTTYLSVADATRRISVKAAS